MKKIGLISLGCSKNLVDSEAMLGQLVDKGYSISPDPTDSDIMIVNTCGFIEPAKKESIDLNERLKSSLTGRTWMTAGFILELQKDPISGNSVEESAARKNLETCELRS